MRLLYGRRIKVLCRIIIFLYHVWRNGLQILLANFNGSVHDVTHGSVRDVTRSVRGETHSSVCDVTHGSVRDITHGSVRDELNLNIIFFLECFSIPFTSTSSEILSLEFSIGIYLERSFDNILYFTGFVMHGNPDSFSSDSSSYLLSCFFVSGIYNIFGVCFLASKCIGSAQNIC